MRLLQQALTVLGTAVVVAVVVALMTPKATHALVAALVQIVPGATTHVGQTQSQLILLSCSPTCFQLFPDGTLGGSAFSVPSGHTLVLTDFEWEVTGAVPSTFVCHNIGSALAVALLNAIRTCAISDSGGHAYGAEHMTTGIVITSGLTIASSSPTYAQGYLVPNQ